MLGNVADIWRTKVDEPIREFEALQLGYPSVSAARADQAARRALNEFGRPVASLNLLQRRALFKQEVTGRITPAAVAVLPLYVGRIGTWLASYVLDDADDRLIAGLRLEATWAQQAKATPQLVELGWDEALLAANAIGLAYGVVARNPGFAWRIARMMSFKVWGTAILAKTIMHAGQHVLEQEAARLAGRALAKRALRTAAVKSAVHVASWYLGPYGWVIDGVLVSIDIVEAITDLRDTVFANREVLAEYLATLVYGPEAV